MATFKLITNIKALFIYRIVCLVLIPASISVLFWFDKEKTLAIVYASITGGFAVISWLVWFPSLVEIKFENNQLSIETEADEGEPSLHIPIHELADFKITKKVGGFRQYLTVLKIQNGQFLQSRTINISFLNNKKRKLLIDFLQNNRQYQLKW